LARAVIRLLDRLHPYSSAKSAAAVRLFLRQSKAFWLGQLRLYGKTLPELIRESILPALARIKENLSMNIRCPLSSIGK
jgi:hypothetical protein